MKMKGEVADEEMFQCSVTVYWTTGKASGL